VSAEPSRAHLFGRLQVLESRVRAAVDARREEDQLGDDRFRGLYITDEDVDRLLAATGRRRPPSSPRADVLLARVEARADAAERVGADVRLRRLAHSFSLSDLDVELFLVALAPDLDPRFERLFAYLHDDVTRRRASTGLALELGSAGTQTGESRGRFNSGGPLLAGGLLLVEDLDRPFLTRPLRVPDRVIAHLLGDDEPDEIVAPAVAAYAEVDFEQVGPLVRSIESGARLVYVQERAGTLGRSLAVSALAKAGAPPLAVDLRRVGSDCDATELGGAAVREARLRGVGLVAGPIDLIASIPSAIRSLAEASCCTLLYGACAWDPIWSSEPPILVGATHPTPHEQRELWRRALNGSAPLAQDVASATAQFRLAPEQVARAATAARRLAAARRQPLGVDDVQAAARAENSVGLERLARRIRPQAGWDDLVLPTDVVVLLAELAARLRHRQQVLDTWGMGRGFSRGRGITCLFAGDSGTGKTMSAEVIAGELALDLYVIDLSTVVDKYVGETEKNLDSVFAEAEGVNGVLLFDEADALFGKRSEVKDARDRWANVEVAYLLQRMELFDGMAILATNLRANVDEAFTRRLDAVVDFPVPDEEQRRLLWQKHLRRGPPLSSDLDTEFLGRSFKLTGGNIRNVALAAAYLAAAEDTTVGMSQVIRAVQREYRKLGRLCVESEFGPYYALVATPES
jgi:ATPase family associated with various cellular activities (AAA)